jgi:sulfite exporter TauE/SafE
MQSSLAMTALLMGLVGGPHCVALCGAAWAGIGRAAGDTGTRALWTFQAGRVLGYSLLGALEAASMQGVGWLSVHSAAIRPGVDAVSRRGHGARAGPGGELLLGRVDGPVSQHGAVVH